MSQEPPSTVLTCPNRFTPYTTYYSSFFLLRTPVTINGQLAEVGYSESSELTLNSRYPNFSVTFHSISSNLETILKKYGVSHVSCFWCEQVPLFQVNFSSEHELRKFLRIQQKVQSELATLFSAKLAEPAPTATPGTPPHDIPTTVQTQLFWIAPDAVKKDAQVVAVTLENHSTCMTLWKESELFDFGALFRVYRLDPSKFPQQGEVELKGLVNELYDVTNWFNLGIHMDVPHPELFAIRHNFRDIVDSCKTAMLTWRMQQSPLTWSDVVRALVGLKMGSLAQKIALKYGVMVPPEIERSPIHNNENAPVEKVSSVDHQLASHIQQMTQEVEVHDNELTRIESSLDQSRKEKALARSKHVHRKNNLTTVHNKTKRLLHERREVRQQLKLKEKELQYLQSFKKHQEDSEDLRAIIAAKETEIMQLRGSLEGLRQELESSREEANSLREQLHQSTTELAKNSVRVQELVRTRADLMTILENERRRVDQLLMQSAATVMGNATKEVKFQLASAKEQYESQFRDTEMESHRQAITQKDEEIRRLSEEVQTLEAQLQEVQQTHIGEDDGEGKLHRLTVETSDLRVQLAEAEGEKLEAVRRLEGVQREKREMEQWIAELEKKVPADPQKCTAVGSGVEVTETAQITQAQPKFCVALYDYKSQRQDELDIHVNEELEVLEWDSGKGWCRGRKQSGQEGYFPQSYVQPSSYVFEVRLVDTNGDPCTTTQGITAELKSVASGSVTKIKVVSKAPATYEVSYQPRERGRHDLSVRVNGTPIKGSPFRVYVRHPPQLLDKPVRVIRGLNYPWRVVTTRNGEMIVCELNRLLVYTKDGKKIRTIGSVRSAARSYKLDPTCVAIDGSGNMYVTDMSSHRLFKLNSDGKLVKSIGGKGEEPGEFHYPDGITISKDNKVIVCDKYNHRIQIFDTDLNIISCFGTEGRGEGEFWYQGPADTAIDSTGNLYVADKDNHRIQVFSQSGTFRRTFGKCGTRPGQLDQPYGIYVDHDWVYITETANNRVSVFTTSGGFISSFGSTGRGEGEFISPRGITIDEDGYVYVSDVQNNHIQVF